MVINIHFILNIFQIVFLKIFNGFILKKYVWILN